MAVEQWFAGSDADDLFRQEFPISSSRTAVDRYFLSLSNIYYCLLINGGELAVVKRNITFWHIQKEIERGITRECTAEDFVV